MIHSAGLFGLKNSNRDFSQEKYWGKNQFNSSFPAALLCYMGNENLPSIYIKYDPSVPEKRKFSHSKITTDEIFGVKWNSDKIYFSFEESFDQFSEVLIGKSPIDLVVATGSKGEKHVRGLEIKLTAIPDSTTVGSSEKDYGAELVIRQPTISYLAASIACAFKNRRDKLRGIFGQDLNRVDWKSENSILDTNNLNKIVEKLTLICEELSNCQTPLIVQPIWKTVGKSMELNANCLDSFVWSDLAFTQLLLSRVETKVDRPQTIDRPTRAIIWLVKMLYDCNDRRDGKIDHKAIMDALSFGTKNDKALSISGTGTNPFLACEELLRPRIKKEEIKKIILGKGIDFLSPERRFDAAIVGAFNT
jgi:hypothetical protein